MDGDLYVGGQLWRNEGGERFTRVADAVVGGIGIWGDYDNDGYRDLFCWAGTGRLYRNIDGKRFKAIQTGGPSGGCLPESCIDLPVDFEQLTSAGTIMGSGGMIVMDEGTCMVDVARYFLDFLREESCGKCTPCREGIGHMLSIINAICEGRGREEDLKLLENQAQAVQDFSSCGLGQTAPNPVLTTIRYFRDEYLSHIRDHRCPAGVCTALVTYTIDPDLCNGCTLCVPACPSGAISGVREELHTLDQSSCIKCNACYEVCNVDAVRRD